MPLSIITFAAAALLTVLLGLLLLPLLRRLRIGQTIRAEGPRSHQSKSGTPTMGGVIFVLAMLPLVFLLRHGGPTVWLWLFLFLASAAIGFADDMLKVVWRRSLGLRAKQKLLGQFSVVLIFLFAVNYFLGRGSDIIFPLLGWRWQLGPFYYVLVSVFLVGMINGVNLTDGLDGLAAGVSFMVFAGYWLISLSAAVLPLVAVDFQEISLLAAAMCGCCLGFLFHNHYPAKVFMGDTGSLALGGAVAAFAVLLRVEAILLLLGGVYFLEALSVMIQVTSFRIWGRRVFRMSPLHHHFEAVWGEKRTVAVFWMLSALFTGLALLWVSL